MTTETQVSQDEFFAKMGPLDVNPRVVSESLKERWHISLWTLRYAQLPCGRSESDSNFIEPDRFFLYQ